MRLLQTERRRAARVRRNLFAGFLIGHAQMVPWWSWYLYINPIAYSLCAGPPCTQTCP